MLTFLRPLIMKYILSLVILLNLCSCGLLYESNTPIVYKSQSFEAMKSPEAPDYTSLNSWAVHPNNKLDVLASFESEDPKLAVDVFFIYPTLHSNKEESSWNADIYNTNTRNLVLESSVQYQSSAWYSVGNLYAPYYRQAHLRIFKPEFWKDGGEKAYELAYEDLRQAFLMFLEKFNNDRVFSFTILFKRYLNTIDPNSMLLATSITVILPSCKTSFASISTPCSFSKYLFAFFNLPSIADAVEGFNRVVPSLSATSSVL